MSDQTKKSSHALLHILQIIKTMKVKNDLQSDAEKEIITITKIAVMQDKITLDKILIWLEKFKRLIIKYNLDIIKKYDYGIFNDRKQNLNYMIIQLDKLLIKVN